MAEYFIPYFTSLSKSEPIINVTSWEISSLKLTIFLVITVPKSYLFTQSLIISQGVLEKHSIDEPVSKLGPKVVVIHETQFTDTLDSSNEMVIPSY